MGQREAGHTNIHTFRETNCTQRVQEQAIKRNLARFMMMMMMKFTLTTENFMSQLQAV
jgi:hypothetical protein